MMYREFQQAAQAIFDAAKQEGRLIYNPNNDELRALTLEQPDIVVTKYGSLVAESEPMSRAAMFTQNNIDTEFGKEEEKLLALAIECSAKETLIAVDVIVADGSEGITARLILPKRFAHVAYSGCKLFKPTQTDDPTHQVIMFFDEEFEKNKQKVLPEKSIAIRNAHSDDGRLIKFALNTNYFGEWKKGVFTAEDYRAKLGGDALFLHAGCRKDTLEDPAGRYRTTASLFVALSANGKTSTSCKVLARKGRERSWLIQDDGGILRRDGSFRGFEAGGLFVKTDGLSSSDQIEAYYGALKPETFLENVFVMEDGTIDFFNVQRTSNGRAVIERRDFMHAGGEINAERIDNIFIISRGKTIPAVAKLTHDQATAFMVLGQSMESSAGDPTQAGKIKNVFFYDPFVAGDRAAHANLFHDILKENEQINCYLLNTGWIGEGDQMRDIRLRDTMGILDAVLRGELKDWKRSEKTGLMVPEEIPSIDPVLLHPDRVFAEDVFRREQEALDRQRAEFIAKYPGLHPEVMAVFQH
ncbi:MAG: phosphoenolpyruvate carboxykinase [Pirellulales bacterium]|nr:phosphoenolpyruvate carboxykinase [Pirellulales bacterium]